MIGESAAFRAALDRLDRIAQGDLPILILGESGTGKELAARRLHLDVTEDELARRRVRWKPPAPHSARGWVKLYCSTVQQADKGVDLDFLVGGSGAPVGRESH